MAYIAAPALSQLISFQDIKLLERVQKGATKMEKGLEVPGFVQLEQRS